MGSTFIYRLKPGDAFRIELGGGSKPLDYRLIYVNQSRAYVEPLRMREKRDILEDSPGGRISIAPNIDCDKIDEELEQLMADVTTARTQTVNKMTKEKSSKTRISGDRKFEAKKQERPVREGTIRAKLLAALESGKSDVNKLMKEFDMPRSLLIAHVHEMWKCHGYGYSVTGDVIKIVKPVGGALKSEPSKSTGKKKASKKKEVEKDPLADDEDALGEDDDPLA